MILAAPLLLVGGVTLAGPAPGTGGRESPDADRDIDTVSVSKAQKRIESGMALLGERLRAAKEANDAPLAGCLEDKVVRGRDIMNTATAELLVLRDKSASSQAKTFAAEKLKAAADRMDDLIENAEACLGTDGLEEEDNVTRNELDRDKAIPIEDPTSPPTKPAIPPAIDPLQPPTVASPTI